MLIFILALMALIALRNTLYTVGECKLALAGVTRPQKPTPRGRLVLFQAGRLLLKVEVQIV